MNKPELTAKARRRKVSSFLCVFASLRELYAPAFSDAISSSVIFIE